MVSSFDSSKDKKEKMQGLEIMALIFVFMWLVIQLLIGSGYLLFGK